MLLGARSDSLFCHALLCIANDFNYPVTLILPASALAAFPSGSAAASPDAGVSPSPHAPAVPASGSQKRGRRCEGLRGGYEGGHSVTPHTSRLATSGRAPGGSGWREAVVGARGVLRLLLVIPRLRLPTCSAAAKEASSTEDDAKIGVRGHGIRGADYGVWVRSDVRPPPSVDRIGEIVTRITSAFTAPDLEAAIYEVDLNLCLRILCLFDNIFIDCVVQSLLWMPRSIL